MLENLLSCYLFEKIWNREQPDVVSTTREAVLQQHLQGYQFPTPATEHQFHKVIRSVWYLSRQFLLLYIKNIWIKHIMLRSFTWLKRKGTGQLEVEKFLFSITMQVFDREVQSWGKARTKKEGENNSLMSKNGVFAIHSNDWFVCFTTELMSAQTELLILFLTHFSLRWKFILMQCHYWQPKFSLPCPWSMSFSGLKNISLHLFMSVNNANNNNTMDSQYSDKRSRRSS